MKHRIGKKIEPGIEVFIQEFAAYYGPHLAGVRKKRASQGIELIGELIGGTSCRAATQ